MNSRQFERCLSTKGMVVENLQRTGHKRHVAAKAQVYALMRDRNISQAELAARMGVDPKQVQRLLDLTHQSPTRQIDRALDGPGARPVLSVKAV